METPSQNVHDEAVRRYALDLLAVGYHVNARVAGWFDEPDFISGYRPDIVAHLNDRFVIVEIKKGAMDWPKISALEQYVRDNHSFEIRIFAPDQILNRMNHQSPHGSK